MTHWHRNRLEGEGGGRERKRSVISNDGCFGILREVVIFVLRNEIGETCYCIIISFFFFFFFQNFSKKNFLLGGNYWRFRGEIIFYLYLFFLSQNIVGRESKRRIFFFFLKVCKMFKEFFVVSFSSLLEGRKLGVLFLSCKIVGGKLLVSFLAKYLRKISSSSVVEIVH